MNAETYLSQAIDPATGAIRPLSQILDAEQRAKFAARTATVLSEREAEAAKSETQKRVEHFQREYDHARRNDDHTRAKFLKNHLTTLQDQLASERATEAKIKAFAADRRIQLIRQEADAIAQSGARLLPHSSQLDRDNLVAIARSNDYPDPESQFRDFKELSDRLTDAEIVAEQQKQSAAQVEAARHELTAAQSRVQESELQMMRARREAVADDSAS